MHPAVHTGPSVGWIILFIVGAIPCLYWLRALRLARDSARFFLLNLLKAGTVFFFSMAVLTRTPLPPSQQYLFSGILALVCFRNWRWKAKAQRSRHIPKSVRQAVIERDLKGESFDPQRHHIDHVWPFALGGSHTPDNLRVIEKRKNLQKGAARPRMKEMW
jgi:hypothetical protein